MSFLDGGAACGPVNPLAQFTKHVQDDKSLQRDRLVGRAGASRNEGFREARRAGGAEVGDKSSCFL